MQRTALTPTTVRSGYIELATGGVYTAYMSNATADAGAEKGSPNKTFYGFLAFDASSVPSGSTVQLATVTITEATDTGTADPMTIQLYTGGALDLADLPTTWADGTSAWAEVYMAPVDPPTSLSADIPNARLADLINADDEVVIKVVVSGGLGHTYKWLPTIATASLTLGWVAPTAVRVHEIDSSVATSVSKDSSLGTSASKESDAGNTATLTSTLTTSTGLTSALGQTVTLTSSLPDLEE